MKTIEQKNDFSLAFLTGLLMSIMAGILVSIILSILVLLLPGLGQHAEASEIPPADLLRKADVSRGSVLLKTDQPGLYQPAPLLNTDVHMQVNGLLVRTRVVQRFKNPGQGWMEGVYVFPLPEKSAVDRLRMRIGDRIIEGQIKERQQAKKIYQQAKQSGRKASLVEQERANIFTTSVANIGPDESISIEIEYQQSLRLDDGRLRLRFPLVVAPRYIPGKARDVVEQVSGFDGTGWARSTDQVVDAARITPPVLHPDQGKVNPVSLRVDLNAGFPVKELHSPYHRIKREIHSSSHLSLSLQDKQVPADRDFVLEWKPGKGHLPNAALFSESRGKEQYLMLMVMPPEMQQAQQVVLNREVIYVIDTSGSMGGSSIRQARQALQYAIGQLKPGDYFNVVQFNSHTSQLFEHSVPADQVHIDEAMRYVGALQASGGTEMAAAIRAALQGKREQENGLVRQVIFLTDGSIGNEDALFSLIRDRLGDSRLFTVGIGSAPNSHFMRKAAQFGRGSYTYIGKVQEVDEKMSALFKKIQMPVLSDIKVQWPEGSQVEMWPQRIPDLYAGEPLVFSAKLRNPHGMVTIRGQRRQQQWQISLPLQTQQQSQGVSVLWAREKIAWLMDRKQEGVGEDVVRKGVIDVALKHHLVSRYTSLVAVDVTPARPVDTALHKHAAAVNLPAGWQFDKVFASLPQTATGSLRDLLLGALLILLGCLLSLHFKRKNGHAW